MDFKVLNWNIGGSKFLETNHREDRDKVRIQLNTALRNLVEDPQLAYRPNVISLQEIIQYKEPDGKGRDDKPNLDSIENLIVPPPGYRYYPFPLIDSDLLSSKAKWNKVKKDSDWHPNTYFAQGNAMLFREDTPNFPIWDLSDVSQQMPASKDKHFIEKVHLDSGLYFGDRNTEPRGALVAHLIYDPEIQAKETAPTAVKKPLDIFVVNLHLTTLMMEREGVPEIDLAATAIRKTQLDIVFKGIVSRYNSWRRNGYPERGKPRKEQAGETFDRHSPVWILAGDFNFTEESEEYEFIRKMNFVDTVLPDRKVTFWGKGTKAAGVENDPTLTLDYIFAGPKFISLHPLIEEKGLGLNRVIHDHSVRASDHYPIVSTIPIIL
jgi:endonuclease/exonuclease/phosphatase family metal-dependent hydrolase